MAEFRLDEVCSSVVDCEHKTVPEVLYGSAWAVGTAAMSDGRIDFSRAKRISNETYDLWTRRAVPCEGDLILAREAPVGPVVRVPASPRVALGQRTVLLRPRQDVIDSRYLHFLLMSSEMQHLMHSKSEGSTVRHLNVEDVRALPLPPLPALLEQRAIVDVLGALDDKIESNRRIWRTRLAISVAMYEGLRNRAESFSSLNDLYEPGLSGVWGEEVNTNGELLPTSCLRGRDIEDFIRGDRSAAPTRYVSVKQIESRRFAEGEIWTAGSGTLGPSILMGNEILSVWEYPVTYSNFVKRLVPSARHNLYAVCWHSLDEWRRRGDFRNFQTGTAMPNLDVDAMLKGVQVPDVSDEDARSLAETTLFALNPGLINENRRLGEIREALLPELLSGRLRVKDAESMLENV
jgi:type I restriction enzyme S subunit